MLSSELREKAEELVGRYPVGRSALLPLLHLVQSQDGYLSDDGVVECAQLLGLTKAEVGAVATFYTMYKREPLGRHLVSVCTNFACKVRGGQEVYDRLSQKLGVGHNQTTPDGAITLEHAECLGNCEGAPVVTVDYYNYECLSPDDAEALVDRVVAGDPPPPTRGLVPPGIRDVEYRLAGLGGRGTDKDPQDRGARLGFARATDGGLVPERTAGAGPGAQPVVVGAGAGGGGRPLGEQEGAEGGDEATPAEFAGQSSAEELGADQTSSDRLGEDSGAGGAHDYPPASGEPTESEHGEPRGDHDSEDGDQTGEER